MLSLNLLLQYRLFLPYLVELLLKRIGKLVRRLRKE